MARCFRYGFALVGALLLLSVSSVATLAADLPYDGSDPNSTGCSSTAHSIFNRTVPDEGYIELRYSTGCRTAWTRFTCTNGHGCPAYSLSFLIQRDQDGKWAIGGSVGIGQGDSEYSDQIYDGIGWSAFSCWGSSSYCTDSF